MGKICAKTGFYFNYYFPRVHEYSLCNVNREETLNQTFNAVQNFSKSKTTYFVIINIEKFETIYLETLKASRHMLEHWVTLQLKINRKATTLRDIQSTVEKRR